MRCNAATVRPAYGNVATTTELLSENVQTLTSSKQ